MAKKSSSPSWFRKLRNNYKKPQWSFEYGKQHVYKCEFCPKVFTTGQALGGHKTCHRFNKQQIHDHHHVNKGYKNMKVAFSLSSSPSYRKNDDVRQKRHSHIRVFKGTLHQPPIQQEQLPAVDLLSLLPPRSYNTKKRCRRYLIHHGLAKNTAPIPLLDMSRESSAVNLNVNHPDCKRMKLSSNMNDTEMMQKSFASVTSDHIDETVVKEEKNRGELGEKAASRVVRYFDLNELPTNDVVDEIIYHK